MKLTIIAKIRETRTRFLLELHPESVFRYEPLGIFPVFSYRILKGNSVGKFGIIKLEGALYTHMVTTHRGLLSARILPLALFQCGGGRRLQLVRGARMLYLLYKRTYGKPTIG
jgi:hypothetical protein